MQKRKSLVGSTILTLGLVLGVTAQAADLDMGTRNLLIDKFTNVLKKMPPKSDAREGVLLRLADLLAERGRILSNNQIDKGCMVDCTAGESDRVEALMLYKQALKTLDPAKSGKVLTQVGHLHEILGQQAQAKKFYNTVLSSNVSEESRAEVFYSLAEMDFKAFKFSSAINYFNKALDIDVFARRGMATYRLAWAHHNKGETARGIELLRKMLKDPNLLKRGGDSIGTVDQQFRSEVVHDLAVFLVKVEGGTAVADEIYKLADEASKVQEIMFIAKEYERLGKTGSAIGVYKIVYDNQSSVVGRVETLVHLSQLQLNLKNRKESLDNFDQALEQWKGIESCDKQLCDELKSRIRKYVLDWHRDEKKAPTPELIFAYSKYIEVFSNEVDMRVWLADIYKVVKDFKSSLGQYSKIETLIEKNVGQSIPEGIDLERALLAQVELAEQIGDVSIRKTAYNNYLAQSKNRAQFDQVTYQLGHMEYKAGQYRAAISIFEGLVSSAKELGLKVKAVDLIMDSLVVLKDDAGIYSMAQNLAKLVPSKAKELGIIASKSKLTIAANLGEENPQKAWDELQLVNVEGLGDLERISLLKNKLILAEKLKKVADAELAITSLLGEKSLTIEDREYVLSRRAWLAEMKLDFKTAYSASKKLKMEALKPEEKTMRLALLADLAGENSDRYYQAYLTDKNANSETKQAIVAEIIRRSKAPLKDLARYKKYLESNKGLYASLYQHGYFVTEKVNTKALLADKWLEGSALQKLVWQKNFMANFDKESAKLSKQDLDSKNQRTLARSLKRRVAQIAKLEMGLKKALKAQNWMAQLLSLKIIGDEELRFYNEILALPIPQGLNEVETNQYLSLLSEQASPHKNKSDIMLGKFNEMMAAPGVASKYREAYLAASVELRLELKAQIERMLSVLPETVKPGFLEILTIQNPVVTKINIQEIEAAKEMVRKNPFNKDAISQLLEVETKAGNEKMVQYLKERLSRAPAEASVEESKDVQ